MYLGPAVPRRAGTDVAPSAASLADVPHSEATPLQRRTAYKVSRFFARAPPDLRIPGTLRGKILRPEP